MKDLRLTSPPRAAALALAALSLLALLVLPTTASAGKPLAYFKVGLHASVKLSWKEDLTGSCNGVGEFRTIGNGETTAKIQTTQSRVVVLEKVHGEPLLTSRGVAASLPVSGTLARKASIEGFTVVPPKSGACRPPEPIPPDCGSLPYPADSQVRLSYRTPESTPDQIPAQLSDVIVVDGPYSSEWPAGPAFRNCPSVGRDDLLGAQEGTEPTPPLTMPVTMRGLLKRKRTVLRKREVTSLDALKFVSGANGTRPVRIAVKAQLDFLRLAHKPRGA